MDKKILNEKILDKKNLKEKILDKKILNGKNLDEKSLNKINKNNKFIDKNLEKPNPKIKKRPKSLLIIPKELWEEGNFEQREQFIAQNKVKKTDLKEDQKAQQKDPPRRFDPRGSC